MYIISDSVNAEIFERARSLSVEGLGEAIINRMVEVETLHQLVNADPERADDLECQLAWRMCMIDHAEAELAARLGSPGAVFQYWDGPPQ